MTGVRAKAPGKIILSGEHAVVHGATAVAAVVDIYTHAAFYPVDPSDFSEIDKESSISIHLKDLKLWFFWKLKRLEEAFPNFRKFPSSPQTCSPDSIEVISKLVEEQNFHEDKTFLVSGLSAFLYLYMSIQGIRPGKVIVSSDLPMGAGLGSSASFCVSLSAALILETENLQSDWLKPEDVNLQLINKWAYEGEKIIHGKPSGIDNTVITFGNTIAFKLGELSHIKCDSPVNMLITNTRVARNTKNLVASVSERAKRHPDAMSAVFNSLNMISKELSTIIGSPTLDDLSLTDKDEKLEELMEMSQGLLQCMGVSHPCIETVVRTTLKYNLVSKLTGAGGGGCVLTLLPRSVPRSAVDEVTSELESCGFECFIAQVGGNGLEISFAA
ncbi:Galactokinase, Mevalonate kinase [Zostera marina]|uniref:Mevalonate kinase n=1 Tax=Zostera marina TaxID=29655 RepID=A0A0K9NLX7_ZOSMR|nr:Galactokinase, Mevalonate kinase [Zostera marina]